MSVQVSAGGGTFGGVVVGGAAGGGGASTLPSALPFTGASHVMLFVAVAMILLVAGVLMTGLTRRGRTQPTAH